MLDRRLRPTTTSLLLAHSSGINSEKTTTKKVRPPVICINGAEGTNVSTVERRRRETINEGINELAKVIPGSDKNKGAILQSAVSYIAELLNKQHSWENERATLDIAIKELATRNDKMRESMEQAWAESAKWQKRCRDARLPYEDYDEGALQDLVRDDDDGLDV
jgi:hypothetical protein